MIDWARSHQLTLFLGLTFVGTWAFWIPSAVMFTGTADPDALVTVPWFVALQTLGAAAPSVVAIGLTLALQGKEALRALLRRFRPDHRLIGWYVVALARSEEPVCSAALWPGQLERVAISRRCVAGPYPAFA